MSLRNRRSSHCMAALRLPSYNVSNASAKLSKKRVAFKSAVIGISLCRTNLLVRRNHQRLGRTALLAPSLFRLDACHKPPGKTCGVGEVHDGGRSWKK